LKFTGKEPPKRGTKLESDSKYWQRALAISADGAFAALTGIRYTGRRVNGWRVEAWETDTGQRLKVARGARGFPDGRSLSFHPARPLLAYCTGADEVIFWDAPSRKEVKRFAWGIGGADTVAFSADGLRCAAAGTGKVVVWDVDA
jgi:hypothetical protein